MPRSPTQTVTRDSLAGPLCPEHPTSHSAEGVSFSASVRRARFSPSFEQRSERADALARSVDSLFQSAWDHNVIRPRALLNELTRAVTAEVHDERNYVHDGEWPDQVTARQIVLMERVRGELQEMNRGAWSGGDFLARRRFLSLDVLLSCPVTLRDRRVKVPGTVYWQRSTQPPHEVVGLTLEDTNRRVPLVWAGVGPVADIDSVFFERMPGAYSWWTVSVGQRQGTNVIFLHDFLGLKGRTESAAEPVVAADGGPERPHR
ncbi:MAG: hypothetical protein M3P51_02100 [Chloroflexota bacterium]|nr:hypothetical protein [Chloroflexota bacterium]